MKLRWMTWLFPSRCPYCRKVIASDRTECEECAERITSEGLRRSLETGNICMAPFCYEGAVRDALHGYKYHGKYSYADSFVKAVLRVLEPEHYQTDLVSFVPASPKSLQKRGYDQSRRIAVGLAKELHKPLVPLLQVGKAYRPQHSLSAQERKKNVWDAYEMLPGLSPMGKRILLVDDICTTGYTLAACSRVLMQSGAKDIFCVTVAIGVQNTG